MLDFTQILCTIENKDEYDTADRIFTQHNELMYKIAWSYLKNEQDAEDLVMEVADNICANISAFMGKEDEDMERMVSRYTRNAATNRYHEKGRKKTQSLSDTIDNHSENVGSDEEFTEEDLAVLLEKEHFGKLQQYVDTLPEQQRTILVYRFYDKYTCRKIAALTGMPESTVSTQTGRALKKLAEMCRKGGMKCEKTGE